MTDRLYDLFAEISEQPPEARPEYLQRLAKTDPTLAGDLADLASQLEALPPGFLAGEDDPDEGELPPRIGQYEVEREIGRGGMGIVYAATQDNPRRQVAVKVLRTELVNTDAARRFQHEAEVLGRLEHPGIAHVYEAGSWSDGRHTWPFIAMELIDGVPLETYAADASTREVLELVAKICDAVQHAHQNGIVHRDLKPANILVGEVDGELRPRILDFGVARLADEDRRRTFETNAGQIIGTLAYMSPEQVSGRTDVDTRSDVYALGMILYRLLAGRMPFDLDEKPLPEIARVINEVEAPRLGRLLPELRGDIETIVAKCLEKDADRRYASAAAVGGDLRRFLSDEPITARPASAIYQLRKLARRRRGLVAGLAAGLAALVFGLGAATYGLAQARVALANEKVAREESDAVAGFLAQVLTEARPGKGGRDVTLLEVLDQAAVRVADKLDEQPDTQAMLHSTLARTYIQLGEYAKAAEQTRPAIERWETRYGPDDPRTLDARTSLGELYYFTGKLEAAYEEFEKVVDARRRANPIDEGRLGAALGNAGFVQMRRERYEEAEKMLVEGVKLVQRNDNVSPDERFDAIANLANLYGNTERFDEAVTTYENLIEQSREQRGPDHPGTLLAIANLASVHNSARAYDKAKPLLEEVLRRQRRVLGPSHSKTIITLNNLAVSLQALGENDEAVKLLREGLETASEAYGADSKSALMLGDTLGLVLLNAKRPDEAEPLLLRQLEAMQAKSKPNDIRVLLAREGIGKLRNAQKRYQEAATIFAALVELGETEALKTSPHRVTWRIGWSRALAGRGDIAAARAQLEEAKKLASTDKQRKKVAEAMADLPKVAND